MRAVFWVSLVFVVYVYVGYPLLLEVWARAIGRGRLLPGRPEPEGACPAAVTPVSVIVAAHNEATRLPARIENLLACDFPPEHLQIIVASDGSTDQTAAVLAPYAHRVELLWLPRLGKAAALNAAVERARHPILVFADARQRFASDAISRLVAHFDDPGIGAVSGELVLDCERHATSATTSTIADGVGLYWQYEKWLRRREAIVGSTLGVTGAIYAMRRDLWHPLPDDTLLDDVHGPMLVVLRGYRVTFDDKALAHDEAPTHASRELHRKVRTLAGNFQLLAREPRLLVPGLNPVWLQFMSHKVGRLLVPYALVGLLIASTALARQSPLYGAALALQVGFYVLALYGAVLERRRRTPLVASEAYREAA
jgi:poly-beta-1,6-N-acetyl-D-glucosamine synthase